MIFVDSLDSNGNEAILKILNFNCISYKVTRSNNDLVTSMLFIVLTIACFYILFLSYIFDMLFYFKQFDDITIFTEHLLDDLS